MAIQKTAEGHQTEYDRLNFHDDQFDMAEALMSIAIALFGVTALTQRRWLLVTALVFAGLGALMGLAGFLGLEHPPRFPGHLAELTPRGPESTDRGLTRGRTRLSCGHPKRSVVGL